MKEHRQFSVVLTAAAANTQQCRVYTDHNEQIGKHNIQRIITTNGIRSSSEFFPRELYRRVNVINSEVDSRRTVLRTTHVGLMAGSLTASAFNRL